MQAAVIKLLRLSLNDMLYRQGKTNHKYTILSNILGYSVTVGSDKQII